MTVDPATPGADRAAAALAASGIEHTITRHGRVGSLAEAAAARGVEPGAAGEDVVRVLGADVADVTDPIA